MWLIKYVLPAFLTIFPFQADFFEWNSTTYVTTATLIVKTFIPVIKELFLHKTARFERLRNPNSSLFGVQQLIIVTKVAY